MNEEMLKGIKFDEKGLVPVVVQDVDTHVVLMLAYMNREALDKTLETGQMCYYSRSRQCLWVKGETSGHTQQMVTLSYDCDGDTLLARVKQKGVACHTGNYSCFFNHIAQEDAPATSGILEELYGLIVERKRHPKEGSYTNYLFDKGIDKILKKVGEECAEVIIASKNPDNGELRYEASDLLYHLLVLLCEKNMQPGEIFEELASRRERLVENRRKKK